MKLRKAFLLASLAAAPLLVYACGGKKEGSDNGGGGGDRGLGGANDGGSDGSGGTGSTGSGSVSCLSDKACTPFNQVCDTVRSACVECLTEADCGENSLCTLGVCERFIPCQSSKECGADQVCDPTLGRCVQCVGDTDCAADQICSGTVCHAGCVSDKNCAALNQVCDLAGGFCVDCATNSDCGDTQYCAGSQCVPDVCAPGEGSCSGDDLLSCNAEGSGFDSSTCADGCTEDGAKASCDEPLPNTCAGATADPCTSLPQFKVTQTVDGDPEEFCNIPSKIMTIANAGFVSDSYGTVLADRSSITSNSQAEIRAAWSPGFLHVHVHVVDPLLKTVLGGPQYYYNGDNVQLFVQGSAAVGGSRLSASLPSIDSSDAAGAPQQIYMLPKAGLNASTIGFTVTATAPGAATYAYASRVTNDGYDVELKYPWPAAVAPLKATDVVSFDVMVGVNDDASSSTREFEYGLFMDSGTSASCTAGSAAKGLWCDNGLWCTPTLAN